MSLNLSPCDYSVTLRIAADDIDYVDTFATSRVVSLITSPNKQFLDVTIGRFSNDSILGLQVMKTVLLLTLDVHTRGLHYCVCGWVQISLFCFIVLLGVKQGVFAAIAKKMQQNLKKNL